MILKNKAFFFFTFFHIYSCMSFGKLEKQFFSIPIMNKTIHFSNVPNISWQNFCSDKKMGCARFKIKNPKDRPTFGLVRALIEKMPDDKFENYCLDVFNISKNTDHDLTGYKYETIKSKDPIRHCYWNGKKDKINFYLKKNIVFVVNTSDLFDFNSTMVEAKINE